VVENFVRGENAEIISSSNLTQGCRRPILLLDRVLSHYGFVRWLRISRGHRRLDP